MKKLFLLIILLIVTYLTLLTSNYIYFSNNCIKSHEESYYSQDGTALAITTKNPGFIAYNGYKTKIVCDEWK